MQGTPVAQRAASSYLPPGAKADAQYCAALLRSHVAARDLPSGHRAHQLAAELDLHTDLALRPLLVQLYGMCGSFPDALSCFESYPNRDAPLWRSIIRTFTQARAPQESLRLLHQMQVEALIPDHILLSSILSTFPDATCLVPAKHLHAQLCIGRVDVVIGNALVSMYDRCSRLEDACEVFRTMAERNLESWNFMISAHIHKGQLDEAYKLFIHMLQEGASPDKVCLVSLISACAKEGLIDKARYMHTFMLHVGLGSNVTISTTLMTMYAKTGNLNQAYDIFQRIPEHSPISWNVLMTGHFQHGDFERAQQFFYQMQQEGVNPDEVTFAIVISAHGNQTAAAVIRQLHTRILLSGFESDVVIATALLNLYGKCNMVDYASAVFRSMRKPNRVTWNSMIAVYAHHGHSEDALQCFREMEGHGIQPDKVTLINILRLASYQDVFIDVNMVRELIRHVGSSDVSTALINMYGKCGSLQEAENIFDKVEKAEIVTWNAMIAAYVQGGAGRKALELFDRMHKGGLTPDNVTFINVLPALSGKDGLIIAKLVHACIIHYDLETEIMVKNALITMYARCNSVEDAEVVFEKIERDVVSWNAILSAYAQWRQMQDAEHTFKQMQQENVVPDHVTYISILDAYASEACLLSAKRMHCHIAGSHAESAVTVATALVNTYGKCKSQTDADKMFQKMSARKLSTWNSYIGLLAQHGCIEDMFQLFLQMQLEGAFPDEVTFSSILAACDNETTLAKIKVLHIQIREKGLESIHAVSLLILDLYCKLDSLRNARRRFDKLSKHDTVSWTTIISAYAQCGLAMDVMILFESMQLEEVIPDIVTYTSILSGFSHAGLVDASLCFLCAISSQQHIVMPNVDLYDCLIDILGRAGQLHKAEDLIDRMPVQPSSVSWMALLGACAKQGDIVRGERAATLALELNPNMALPYLLLSNLHAASEEENIWLLS